MHTTTPHGVLGCHCEDCLELRIRLTAETAIRDRTFVPLWARQLGFRVRLASEVMRRRVS
jgi:hypothetical protein